MPEWVQVNHASIVNGHVTEAVGARAPATVIDWLIVPAVGSRPSATARVAAAVVAVVPHISSSSDRPTGFGFVPDRSQFAGILHTVLVPRTPVNAACVVYVFLVMLDVSVYSSSAWVPVLNDIYCDQITSMVTGVEVTTVGVQNTCNPLLAAAFAMAGTCHSYPVGGNSSHADPVVCGTVHRAS